MNTAPRDGPPGFSVSTCNAIVPALLSAPVERHDDARADDARLTAVGASLPGGGGERAGAAAAARPHAATSHTAPIDSRLLTLPPDPSIGAGAPER